MSFKTTGLLVTVLVVLAVFGCNTVFNKPPPAAPTRPFVYTFAMENIVDIDVRRPNAALRVVWDEANSVWNFADAALGEVDGGRMNGIRLLLSGPGANRVLFRSAPSEAQLADYGFNRPIADIRIKLKDGSSHRVLLGDQTPDGRNYYTKSDDSATIYLVDFTWGNEIVRFVTEPPVKKATGGNS
ncbi:MAG: DUF4340 domain-containing protein [Dehalococcoidia bacterium]|nr:DUF4340 domain-containing protein [Dehalococcoidia bacterium]